MYKTGISWVTLLTDVIKNWIIKTEKKFFFYFFIYFFAADFVSNIVKNVLISFFIFVRGCDVC